MIDTATNTVVATITAGGDEYGVAVSPDGTHVYVNNDGFGGTVLVIDTATNKVVTMIPLVPKTGTLPDGIAITPDGTHLYVTTGFAFGAGNVLAIATATNTIVATVPVVGSPGGVAVTPDGKHAYVADGGDNPEGNPVSNVLVIDTATNAVAATVPVGRDPTAVGIVPPPPGVPFLAFDALLEIPPSLNAFQLESSFTLSSTAPAINPVTQAVALQVGTFSTTIPAGSFKNVGGKFPFEGVIGGVTLRVLIAPTGTLRYGFFAAAQGASLTGTTSPVPVSLTIGNDTGTTSVTGLIFH